MSKPKHLDDILRDWPHESNSLMVRIVEGSDGREVLQMRVDMGVLQLEMTGRPDGERPEGAETMYDHLLSLALNGEVNLSDEQCVAVDREFVQFYHRRICWLQLQRYRDAVQDADHTLGLMDFCRDYAPDEQWMLSHEQYRPFVLFHRTQAAALAHLDDSGPEKAVEEISLGLETMRTFFSSFDGEEDFEDDELVIRLRELQESLRKEFDVGRTLNERLADAVASEQYELAAKIRDELKQRSSGH